MDLERPSPESVARQVNALEVVRRRVLAIGFLSIALHGVVALVWIGVIYRHDGRATDSLIMFIMSAVVGLLTCAATRAILGTRIWSWPWFAVSVVPTIVCWFWF